MCVCVRACVYMYVFVHMCVCMYVCVCMCVYVCVHYKRYTNEFHKMSIVAILGDFLMILRGNGINECAINIKYNLKSFLDLVEM